ICGPANLSTFQSFLAYWSGQGFTYAKTGCARSFLYEGSLRSGWNTISVLKTENFDRLNEYIGEAKEGVSNEQGTSSGWHAQGRVRPDVGRQTQTVGRQRPPLCGLGDLPPQGISR